MRIVIRNGIVISPEGPLSCDVVTDEGIITFMGCYNEKDPSDRVIDASGMYLLPGGVDPHVHMHLKAGGVYSSDDFRSGSIAAIYGGTTTLIDFVTPERGDSLAEALRHRATEASGCLTDYTFHVSPVEWRPSTAAEIDECIAMGITSFKVYMAYKSTVGLDDREILKVMEHIAGRRALVTMHCELGDKIEELRSHYAGKGCLTPLYHALSRPPSTESDAVRKAVEMASATGCRLYIVHLSTGEAVKHVREARRAGVPVTGETCPQYLLLDDSAYEGPFEKTAPFIMSPPLREEKDREALWEAINDGTLSTIGTDHCPFPMTLKRLGAEDFRKIPGGAGGVEHRLALLFTYGVIPGKITINEMVALCSSGPAKAFGMYPAKGALMQGSDADIVIWDPQHESIISSATHHQNCDTNIYEGMPVKGKALLVIRRGEIILDDGIIAPEAGNGIFVRRPV